MNLKCFPSSGSERLRPGGDSRGNPVLLLSHHPGLPGLSSGRLHTHSHTLLTLAPVGVSSPPLPPRFLLHLRPISTHPPHGSKSEWTCCRRSRTVFGNKVTQSDNSFPNTRNIRHDWGNVLGRFRSTKTMDNVKTPKTNTYKQVMLE